MRLEELKELIRSIVVTTKLYRQPHRVGDVLESNDTSWLVIGIQNVEIIYSRLKITYICQNLNMDYVYQPSTPTKNDKLVEFYITIRTGKEHILETVSLGRMFKDKNNNPYQSIEYTDVEIKHTDVVVSVLARPIRPIPRKEAKAKLRNEKIKKLKLEIL